MAPISAREVTQKGALSVSLSNLALQYSTSDVVSIEEQNMWFQVRAEQQLFARFLGCRFFSDLVLEDPH